MLSHQDHFKFGYNGQWFRLRESPSDVFTVAYGQCTTEPGDFRQESIRAARLIGEAADAPIHVLFSGGVDSEVTMLSFLAAAVPITAAILRFHDGLNRHDIDFAIQFCVKHGVPYRLYDLDILRFMHEQVLDYTTPVRCNAPMMAAAMWLIDQIDGFPVMGQGEPFLLRPEQMRPHRLEHAKVASHFGNTFTDQQWALQESETVNGWYRHYLLRGRSGVPGFHQYTPEQILAYLRDPYVIEMMATSSEINNETWKLPHYRRHFTLQERPKYTGYEKIMLEIDLYRRQHLYAFPHSISFVLFDCDRLADHLAPK